MRQLNSKILNSDLTGRFAAFGKMVILEVILGLISGCLPDVQGGFTSTKSTRLCLTNHC